jgi:carbamoyl-phosphate synthase large subunit
MKKIRVLIAGIGGASLGTEIAKCLSVTTCYTVFGCDISPLAFGHYYENLKETFIANSNDYVPSVIEICRKNEIPYIIPGGEAPLYLLNAAILSLQKEGLRLVSNTSKLVADFADKHLCFEILQKLGVPIPLTIFPQKEEDLDRMTYPCVVKPATGSGGSDFVFIAKDKEETEIYIEYLLRNARKPLLQEYIPTDEGEMSFGVLSLPGKEVVGSIALKRFFTAKLSIHAKTDVGIISSPYSQGLIDEFYDLRRQAEHIALAIGSEGPLNIQGRIRQGQLIPFEINPRFSGSDFVRAMAGFNQPHIFLHYLATGKVLKPGSYRYGYYLRSLSEVYVHPDKVKK